jgi:hypothetical protein
MTSQRLNNTNNVGPETPGGSPRTSSINTEIAEVVQIRRVRNQDVNITGITPRRQAPLQNNVLSRGKGLGANDSYDTINGTPQPLKTPWESVWHRDLPVDVKVKREQTPGGHSVADTAIYSLSDAASEEEQGDTTTANFEQNVPLSTSSSSRKDTIERKSLLSHPPKFQEREKATQTKKENFSSSSSKEVPSMASFLSPFPLPFRQPTPTWLRSPSTLAMVGAKAKSMRHTAARASMSSGYSESSIRTAEELELLEKLHQQSVKTMDETHMRKDSVARAVQIVKDRRVQSMEGIVEDTMEERLERGDSALGMEVDGAEDGELPSPANGYQDVAS